MINESTPASERAIEHVSATPDERAKSRESTNFAEQAAANQQRIATLRDLIARVRAAEGPDRRLDAEIECFLRFPHLRPAEPDDHKEFQRGVRPSRGDIWCPTGFLMSSSLTGNFADAKAELPEGWYWRAGVTTCFSGWAFINRVDGSNALPGDEFCAKKSWPGKWSAELALICAILLYHLAAAGGQEEA